MMQMTPTTACPPPPRRHRRVRSALLAGIILLLGPAFLWADYQQAMIYYGRGMYDKAIEAIKPDVDAHPNDWEPGHRILGLCYVQTKRYTQAIASLTKAVQLKSNDFSTYWGLAIAYLATNQMGRVTSVLTEGERLAKTSDQRYDLFHARGSAYFQQKHYNEAARDFTEALRLRSNDPNDYSQLGLSYYYTKRFDDAIPPLTKAVSLKPNDTALQDLLGRCYRHRGAAALEAKRYAQALEDLNKALTYNAKDGALYYDIGLAHLLLSHYDEAERALTRSAELLSGRPDPYQQLGFLYEKKKQYGKALEAYKKAYDLKKSPDLKASLERVTQAAGGK